MEFDFTKNIYLYKGRCDLYVFGDETGFKRVVDSETLIRKNDYYNWSYQFVRNDVKQKILADFESGWADCTKVISKDVSFSKVRLK